MGKEHYHHQPKEEEGSSPVKDITREKTMAEIAKEVEADEYDELDRQRNAKEAAERKQEL